MPSTNPAAHKKEALRMESLLDRIQTSVGVILKPCPPPAEMQMTMLGMTEAKTGFAGLSRLSFLEEVINHVGNGAGTSTINQQPDHEVRNGIHGFPLNTRFKQPAERWYSRNRTARYKRYNMFRQTRIGIVVGVSVHRSIWRAYAPFP